MKTATFSGTVTLTRLEHAGSEDYIEAHVQLTRRDEGRKPTGGHAKLHFALDDAPPITGERLRVTVELEGKS